MTHWDGLSSVSSSGQPQRILILGATNRIQDIDDAILRRMPKKFPVSLPTASQRSKILKLILKDTKIDQNNFDMDYLVKVMAGMSGSEIKEACRDAAMVPVREMLRRRKKDGLPMDQVSGSDARGIRTMDFFKQAGGIQTIQQSIRDHEKGTDAQGWSTESSSPDADSDMEDAADTVQA
jgi:SpoVK/Ycf46/Vps4 family AAA+-type ATPase